jgi:hypothetical protein
MCPEPVRRHDAVLDTLSVHDDVVGRTGLLDATDSLVRRISRVPNTFTRQVMNLKRIFRSPLAWIVIAVIAIGLLIDFSQRVTSGTRKRRPLRWSRSSTAMSR